MPKRNLLMKTLLIAIMAVAVMLTGALAFAQSDAQVRFVHAFVDAPDVDIYVNSEVVAEGVPFGAASDYINVTAGDIAISVTAAGESDALFEQTVTTGSEPVTLVVSSANGFTPYVENVDPLNVGQARLTAIHAIEGAPAVDVVLVDGRPVIAGLEYDVAYGTLDVPVFNYGLNVVPSGEGLASAIFAEPFNAALATGTSYTAVVYGTLDAPEVMLLATPVSPKPGDGFLTVSHNVEGAPAVDVYANDNLVITSLAFGESTESFPIAAGDYNIQVAAADTIDIIVGGDVTVAENAAAVASVVVDGDDVTIVVEADEPMMVEEETEVSSEVVVAESEVVTETTSEVVVAEVVVQPTPVPAQAVQPTAAPANTGSPTARVVIDPGANLQLRQYPDSSSLSLGLAPAGAVMTVNGRVGAPVQIEGLFSQELQDEIDAYVDPAEGIDPRSDIDPNNTWLNVTYTTPDGGNIEAWVLAQYMDVNAPDGQPQRLADLPTVPSNNFGESSNTEVTPPPVAEDAVSAVVYNLNPGVNLQIRRTSDRLGESLGLIPNGTVLEYIGFEISPDEVPGIEAAENAEWAFIRYIPPEGGEVTGWVSTTYIEFFWRGEEIDFEEMQARNFLLFEDPDTRGELGRGAVAPPRPTVDPLADVPVATVVIDAGANLQFRRNPDALSESLGLIPSGTQLIVSARDASGEWLLVDFEGQSGWIASDFVRLTLNGRPIDLDELLVESDS